MLQWQASVAGPCVWQAPVVLSRVGHALCVLLQVLYAC
jgi:hypothetical protein